MEQFYFLDHSECKYNKPATYHISEISESKIAEKILNGKSFRRQIVNNPQNETDYKPNYHDYENC